MVLALLVVALGVAGTLPLGLGGDRHATATDNCRTVMVERTTRIPEFVVGGDGELRLRYRQEVVRRPMTLSVSRGHWARRCGCDLRLVDDLTEPPKGPRRDLMDVGPADAETAGDFVRGEIGAISQREHLPLAWAQLAQPVLYGLNPEPPTSVIVRGGKRRGERGMRVERRAAAVALATEVISQHIARDGEDPGPDARAGGRSEAMSARPARRSRT